ncbi:metalloregulator ArsR/SmtB family transcription factor [Tissierella sp. Yu-01]|uniref:ArsR/SmtB family transcription factor n=1 Tax=Tissierella sp. Yu-01 TaxID=3035694 RepID=UPI00240E0100|nr:metalloregulator ArsR/SmtB family transcription factor [Tissierella sp. Yu-01]WFA10177.1 metalloregulator ArsR/SmtB family transcription factor [Tissierella sp. Yu-01]
MEEAVKVFKALGDETRLKILVIIAKRNICAKGISRHLGISEAAVSQHLKALKEANIIKGEKKGYFVQYEIQESTFSVIANFIEEIIKNEISYENLHMPMECIAECNIKKNKCCHRNSN